MHTMPLMMTALLVIDVQYGLFGGAPNPMGARWRWNGR